MVSVKLTRGRLEPPIEVESRQRFHPGDGGQVEVDRSDRDVAIVDGGQIGTFLMLVARLHAVDPVALAATRIFFLERELVVVAALAEPRYLSALYLAGGRIDVDQGLLGEREVVELGDDPRRERRNGVEIELAPGVIRGPGALRLLGHGERGNAQHDALERGRDGARV